jgi:hypothetical protein
MMAGISARLSRRGRTAVLIGGIGYAWSLALVFRPACSAMLKPSAEDQQPYAPPGDSHYGDENAVFTRLKGWLPTFRRTRKHACWYGMAIWRDKGPLVRGRGPSNGANVTYWVTETINGQAFMARYSFDLSYLVEPGTGAIGFSHSAQHDENTRLIERIPPPTPGPPGWRVIQPGQCVLARAEPSDTEGTTGRFLIDLPSKALVRIESELSGRLSLGGKETAHEPIPGAEMGGFRYRTSESGRYAISMHRPPGSDRDSARPQERLRYSLMVVWGETEFTGSCTSPRDDLSCLGDEDDD